MLAPTWGRGTGEYQVEIGAALSQGRERPRYYDHSGHHDHQHFATAPAASRRALLLRLLERRDRKCVGSCPLSDNSGHCWILARDGLSAFGGHCSDIAGCPLMTQSGQSPNCGEKSSIRIIARSHGISTSGRTRAGLRSSSHCTASRRSMPVFRGRGTWGALQP